VCAVGFPDELPATVRGGILTPLLRWYPSAWVLSRLMGVLPIEMVQKYHSFVAVGIRNTPQLVC